MNERMAELEQKGVIVNKKPVYLAQEVALVLVYDKIREPAPTVFIEGKANPDRLRYLLNDNPPTEPRDWLYDNPPKELARVEFHDRSEPGYLVYEVSQYI